MNLLHIDSSILGPASVSRTLSAAIVERLTQVHPQAKITYRDLAAVPVPHLSGPHLAAARGAVGAADASLLADLELGNAVLQDFLEADVVFLGLGLYNFGVPSQLKAWVDRIVIAGKTFRYTEDGRPMGLAGGKRVLLAIARGGFYGPGAPAQPFEHADSYLRHVFAFIGIDQVETIAADGVAAGPQLREVGIARARESLAALAA